MDAGRAFDERRVARGRRSRVVLTPRRWRQALQKYLRGDGDKKARSPGRVRRKPLKPLRAGMPGDPGATVVTTLVRSLHFAHEAAGATGTRHSPLPSWRREVLAQLGRFAPRECGCVSEISAPSEARHARACPGYPRFGCGKDVDGRNKSGHDDPFVVVGSVR